MEDKSNKTEQQYDKVISDCVAVIQKKHADYGPSWRLYTVSTLVDKIFVKTKRIRTIYETGTQLVGGAGNDILSEYKGILNYCIFALIQEELGSDFTLEPVFEIEKLNELLDKFTKNAKELMIRKNHDYGEAWRDVSKSYFPDEIGVKLIRIRELLKTGQAKGTESSEGIDANFYDIINYAIFALIRIDEQRS